MHRRREWSVQISSMPGGDYTSTVFISHHLKFFYDVEKRSFSLRVYKVKWHFNLPDLCKSFGIPSFDLFIWSTYSVSAAFYLVRATGLAASSSANMFLRSVSNLRYEFFRFQSCSSTDQSFSPWNKAFGINAFVQHSLRSLLRRITSLLFSESGVCLHA